MDEEEEQVEAGQKEEKGKEVRQAVKGDIPYLFIFSSTSQFYKFTKIRQKPKYMSGAVFL